VVNTEDCCEPSTAVKHLRNTEVRWPNMVRNPSTEVLPLLSFLAAIIANIVCCYRVFPPRFLRIELHYRHTSLPPWLLKGALVNEQGTNGVTKRGKL
jgi:hypothetical protein